MRKQVAISETTADDLGRVAKQNNVSRDMIISKMLEFFRIYGIDPFKYDPPHEEMTKIIKRMDDLVKIIRKIEKDTIKPTFTESAAVREEIQQLKNSIGDIKEKQKDFNKVIEQWGDDYQALVKSQQKINENLVDSLNAIKQNQNKHAEKSFNMIYESVQHHTKMSLSDKDELLTKWENDEH